MKSTKFPNATFTGKIIENVNFSQTGVIPIQANGRLILDISTASTIENCSQMNL